MRSTRRRANRAGTFLAATTLWAVPAVAAWAVAAAVVASGRWPVTDFVEMVAMTIAFCSFAGGLTCPWLDGRPKWEFWSTFGAAILLGASVWGLLAYAAPWVDFRFGSVAGPESRLALGPLTPSSLRGLREIVSENPGLNLDPRPSSADPFLWASNWIDYTLSRPRTAGFLTIVNTGLGILCATLSIDLRPGMRRRVRWAAGLASALTFIVVDGTVASVIAVDAAASGWLWSALTVTPHLGVLVLLWLTVRISAGDRRGTLSTRGP